MARQKISEYKAKTLVTQALSVDYQGWPIVFPDNIDSQIDNIANFEQYAVKVDQGIKGRYKKGLIALDVNRENIKTELNSLHDKGYEHFIVEPQMHHEQSEERYIAISQDKSGVNVSYSKQGGVDIEANTSTIKAQKLNDSTNWQEISEDTGMSLSQLKNLQELFSKNFITMLEINPYIVRDGKVFPLDAAIEVDDSGTYFVDSWSPDDFRRSSSKKITSEEAIVNELDENSPASLKLEVLNPDGSIFLLLSGGGASVVVADEVYNLGLGEQIANYGEYSGNPNTEETYLYTKALLGLVIKSKAPKKVLFIGGAVANFTDIANTFKGIIQAIDEMSEELKKQDIQVFVRRGGPRQEIGLKKIQDTLTKHNLLGAVYDPSTPLTGAVCNAIGVVK